MKKDGIQSRNRRLSMKSKKRRKNGLVGRENVNTSSTDPRDRMSDNSPCTLVAWAHGGAPLTTYMSTGSTPSPPTAPTRMYNQNHAYYDGFGAFSLPRHPSGLTHGSGSPYCTPQFSSLAPSGHHSFNNYSTSHIIGAVM